MQDKIDLLEGLKRAPGILSEFVKSIPEERIFSRRGEGFWTIAEHVSHLAEVQPMLLDRFQRFMDEDRPEFVPCIPEDGGDEPVRTVYSSVSDALDNFALCRNKEIDLLESARDIMWHKRATHPEYESYSLYILARHTLMHDFWHMYRIEELWLTRDAYLTKLE
ncbi:DinB family protein [Syntrophobacter sp. SbD1]|nr:DinB family protein [Syntrophobacter sp. SbD1]